MDRVCGVVTKLKTSYRYDHFCLTENERLKRRGQESITINIDAFYMWCVFLAYYIFSV